VCTQTRLTYRRTTISLSIAAITSWAAYFTGLIYAEVTDAPHTPFYGAFAYVALTLSFGAFGYFALGRHHPRPDPPADETPAAGPVEDTDSAPTIRLTIPEPTRNAERAYVPPQRTVTERGSVYRCDPGMPQAVTMEMRPAGYVEMIPVRVAEELIEAVAEEGRAAGRRGGAGAVAPLRPRDNASANDDHTFLAGLGLAAEKVLGGNDELAVDPDILDAARRIARRLRPGKTEPEQQ